MDTGFFLDITTDTPGIINITGAETFDFEIEVADTPIGWRYTTDSVSGNGGAFELGTVAADGQMASINAFTVSAGDGILTKNEGPVFVDTGYDAAADAFLIGRLDFEVIGQGKTNLLTEAGSGGIVHAGQTVNPVLVAHRLPEFPNLQPQAYSSLDPSCWRLGDVDNR